MSFLALVWRVGNSEARHFLPTVSEESESASVNARRRGRSAKLADSETFSDRLNVPNSILSLLCFRFLHTDKIFTN